MHWGNGYAGDVKKIADQADMVINGHAYTRDETGFRVIDLNNLKKAAVLSAEGEMLVIPS